MTHKLIYAFDPIADDHAKVLILGSMPGQASLTANQYYANRNNAFWKIMADTFDFSKDCTYEIRLNKLQAAEIAVWDVLKSCQRAGSLDANIVSDSITVNNFLAFLNTHTKIDTVLFNGAKAESAYRKYVLATVNTIPVNYIRLPSTSPAHASLSYELKLKAWQAALNGCLG